MWMAVLFLFSFSAKAQFEDFENILAPSTLTPKIGIVCKSKAMMGTTDAIIDVKNGKVTQVMGDKKYIYTLDSFSFQKTQGDNNGVRLDLKGRLHSIVDSLSGKEVKAEKSGSFSLSSYLPTKDNKKFKANQFEISSSVKYESGGSFNINDKTTNSTKCTLVKGGKYIKELNANSSVKVTAEYNVDNSERSSGKDVQTGSATNPGSSPGTTQE